MARAAPNLPQRKLPNVLNPNRIGFTSVPNYMQVSKIIDDTFRLLTFRITREAMLSFTRGHLIFGLACTWLVGMGRYWDDPGASLPQHLGVGSVVYVFCLSFVLWVVVYPLRPKNWSYFHILTFIALVSPPAMLYAIPVERFMSLANAAALNMWFLAIVATWRVALLLFFLVRFAALSGTAVLTAALLPITAIVVTLVSLNLERAVFDIMGGFREPTRSDDAYGLLMLISMLSILLFPVTMISYIILAYLAYARQKTSMVSIKAVENEPEN
jgi:hypothetical protein